jgi:hypothetical protein
MDAELRELVDELKALDMTERGAHKYLNLLQRISDRCVAIYDAEMFSGMLVDDENNDAEDLYKRLDQSRCKHLCYRQNLSTGDYTCDNCGKAVYP